MIFIMHKFHFYVRKDLQSFLDAADEGVIYLSMGSNVKSSSLPKEKLDIFLKVSFNSLYVWERLGEFCSGSQYVEGR